MAAYGTFQAEDFMKPFRSMMALAALAMATNAAQAEQIVVATGVDPAFMSVFVAQERGLFQKAGLDIKILRMAQGGDVMDSIVAGQSHLGVAADQTAMLRIPRADIRPLAVISESGKYIEAIAKPEIKDVKDVKKIGVVKGTVSEYSAAMMLKKHGIDKAAVSFVPGSASDFPALLARGDIDAYFAWHPFATQSKAQGAKALTNSGDVGYVYTMWLSASGSWLDKNRDDARKFVQIVADTNKSITADPAAAAADFQKAAKIPAADSMPLLERITFKVRDFSDADMNSYESIADYLLAEKRTPARVEIGKSIQKGFFKD